MRGIMQSRTKPLKVIEPSSDGNLTSSLSFERPEEKEACKLIDAGNEVELVTYYKLKQKLFN